MIRFLFASLLVVTAPAPVLAISYTSASRSIHAFDSSLSTNALGAWANSVHGTAVGQIFENGELLEWDQSFAVASQTSDLGEHEITFAATLFGGVPDFAPGPRAESSLLVSFVLHQPADFVAAGLYDASGGGGSQGYFLLSLIGSEGPILSITDQPAQISGGISGQFEESGILPAGAYTLSLVFGGWGRYDLDGLSTFSLALVTIPEPGTALLLGLGLLALARRR